MLSGAEVKNEWSNIFTPPIRLHGMGRESFIFTFVRTQEYQEE
jgi:hypothetical protein